MNNRAMNNRAMNNRAMNNRGFTLIELLVVIGVVGVLAGVLVMNVSNARERADEAVAKSYLSLVSKAQESHQVDTARYAASLSDLESKGLKSPPERVTFTMSGSNHSYCASAVTAKGAALYVSPASGVSESSCAP